MPFRDPETLFRDIISSIAQIKEFIGTMAFIAYERDEKTRAAVERKLQVVTEAVIRLEMDYSKTYPQVDWKGYRGMGNFLRHSYDRVSDEIVWNTVIDDLPILAEVAEKALQNFKPIGSNKNPDLA